MLIDRKQVVPCLTGHVGEAALILHEAGVGDGAVDAAHLLDRLCEGFDHAGLVGNVHHLREDMAAEFGEFAGGLFVSILTAAPNDDISAGSRNTARKAEADACIAAGNHDDTAAHVPRKT
nr:hypothetical protein [Novosphingobium sp. ST904]